MLKGDHAAPERTLVIPEQCFPPLSIIPEESPSPGRSEKEQEVNLLTGEGFPLIFLDA